MPNVLLIWEVLISLLRGQSNDSEKTIYGDPKLLERILACYKTERELFPS